jgi:protein TonB
VKLMGNRIATFLPNPGHVIGFGSSFVIHAIGVFCVIYMSSVFSNIKPSLIIDFNIQKFVEEAKVQKRVSKIADKQGRAIPRIVPVAPPLKPVTKIEKRIEPTVNKIEHKPDIVPEEVTAKIIVRRLAKKKFAAVKNIETETKRPTRIIADEVASPERLLNKGLPEFSSTRNGIFADGPEVIKSPPPKELYLKEHFLYIKESVQNKITYPPIARKMGWQGRVLISFVICRDGSVKDIRIVKSSGFKALDNKAMEVIQKTAPFPRPPVSAELIIPITYKLS